MERSTARPESPSQHERYAAAAADFGAAIERIAAGYEADRDKRRDLAQDIHLQLWRSFEVYDGRCSLKTWTFRVAHNTAVSYINRERRKTGPLVSLEEITEAPLDRAAGPDIDRRRALDRLSRLILQLKPLDRQVMLSYLEDMDAAAIAEITGLSPANVAMKIHRMKSVLARHFFEEQPNV